MSIKYGVTTVYGELTSQRLQLQDLLDGIDLGVTRRKMGDAIAGDQANSDQAKSAPFPGRRFNGLNGRWGGLVRVQICSFFRRQ